VTASRILLPDHDVGVVARFGLPLGSWETLAARPGSHGCFANLPVTRVLAALFGTLDCPTRAVRTPGWWR
jgi:hypothetical protein